MLQGQLPQENWKCVFSVQFLNVSTTDGTTSGALGGLGAATNGVNALTTVTASQATSGEAFSFTNSYTQGDAVITTAPTVGEVSAFSNQTSYTNWNCWKPSRYCRNRW